jgi:putative ABC transport system permease protein
MKSVRALFLRLTGMFGRRRREREFAAEMESNLQMHIEDNMRTGMSPEEARRQALLRFGGANSARDRYEQQSGLPFLETLWQDLRYGTRTLRKTPGFTFVVVLTLALGIGANTAIFSIINAVLLKPLPFKDPDKLIQLWETEASPGNFPLNAQDYLDWQQQNQTLEKSALYGYGQWYNASAAGEAQPVDGVQVQASYFSVLQVMPEMGRTFAPEEGRDGPSHVMVISHGMWKKFFAGRADVIGQKLELNSEPYEVIGVMPDWYVFPSLSQFVVPLDMSKKNLGGRGNHGWRALARVKADKTVEQARADLLTISKRLEQQYHGTNAKVNAIVVPLKEQITGYVRPQLIVLLVAVAAVLLVACVNVANLLLARATGRQREIALRAVLGASRARVIRQLLTESVLLSMLGAALGLGGAWWAVELIRSTKTLPIPRVNLVQVDFNVLLFTLLVSLGVGILFGLAPALQASSAELTEELKSSAQSVVGPLGWQRFLRDGLVIGEIAISLALLACAGLLLRSFDKMCRSDIGVQPQGVLTMSVTLPDARYTTAAARADFVDRYLERLQHSPGIQAAAMANEIPLEGGNNGYVKVEGDTDPAHAHQLVENNYITPDYFRVLGIPFIQGSNFSAADFEQVRQASAKRAELYKKDPDAKVPPGLSYVAIINQKMADTFWPNQNPVGKIYKGDGGSLPVRIIGVVGNTSVFGIQTKPFPEAYYPLAAVLEWGIGGEVLVKTTGDPAAALPVLRNHLRELDSSLAAFKPRTMEQVVSDATEGTGVQTWLLGSFAALALVLAAIGLYSVLAYLVTQRTREIGIRMALGAQHSHILRLVVGHGGKLTLAGLFVGVISALLLTRLLGSLLFGVTAKDPLTFASVVAVMTVVALAACYIPAYRAMRVEPTVALRDE